MKDHDSNIIMGEKSHDLFYLLENLNETLERNTKLANSVTSDLIDADLLDEIVAVVRCRSVGVYFGKSLRYLKVVIHDDGELRDHEIFLQYKAPRKLIVSNANLPNSSILNREYRSLDELIETFKKYINDLEGYFFELENIDKYSTIMEPINATFRDDFRRIYLDDRTWLHVEVTTEGLATNIHLIGESLHWHNKLQTGLLKWNHDKNIIENILTTFDLSALPEPTTTTLPIVQQEGTAEDTLVCGICLCQELPDVPGVPQPLCQNNNCGVHYHRNCLYQWLVECAGSRPPAFGVANGACPTCLQPITCSEKDN